ncbi:HD domain-containing protein [Rubrobacter taiwanensis]|uniref:HD domain-containing protein n=1 Tax=Rubrobacter taiwanensis TaxID=185139 RepID=A0A4R1BL25_9ACTN|nr:HD domain-containing protein [Rubrobacter taiwanensis]TCJ18110.1 HD domain-containing protein [Rubrobacter taiwanensis]
MSGAEELFHNPGESIRDGVWGDIPVNHAVRSLLDTPSFQRLRGIQQLGFTSYTFPGAHHTRFEHSVGVYHLTRLAIKRLLDSGAYLREEEVRGALAAALLHDIGHYPFSHAIEELALPHIIPHEELGQRVIEKSEVGEVLQKEWGLAPGRVSRLVARTPPEDLTPTEQLARDLLSGSLDVDKLDYLVRDARYAGVPYGMIDVERLIQSLRVVGIGNEAVLAIDESGIGALQSLVFARYLMFYNVYWHHTTRTLTVMFLRAVQDALAQEKVSPEDLSLQDDAGILELLLRSSEPGDSTNTLIRRIKGRQLYRRAVELDDRHPSFHRLTPLKEDATWRRRVEEAWARYLTRYHKESAGPSDILIDLPENKRFTVEMRVIRRHPLPGERNPVTWAEVSGLNTDDMARYHARIRRVRVVASNEALARSVRHHAEELFTIAEEIA